MGPNKFNLARTISGSVLLLLAVAAMFAALNMYLQQSAERAIEHPDADETLLADVCLSNDRCRTPSQLLRLAEALATGNHDEKIVARDLVHRALESDPLRPGGWALLSYLETSTSGEFTPVAANAMRKSIELCPLCDNTELLRWRFNFVLQTWEDVPEDIRIGVFESADLLRWWHLDSEFLHEQAALSAQWGVPFDEYRAKIDTPVRPHEVGRARITSEP